MQWWLINYENCLLKMSNSLNFRMAISNGEEANNGNTEVDNVVSNGLFFVNWWGVSEIKSENICQKSWKRQ